MTAAITGIGMVTAQGVGRAATWAGVRAACDVLRPWSQAPETLATLKVAECPALPRPGDLPARLWHRLGRVQQLGAVAADEALAQAGLESLDGYGERAGLFVATTVCGMDLSERFYEQYRLNPTAADDDLMRRLQPYELATLLARRHRIGGPRQVCLTTCVGSAMAIGAAMDYLASGAGDVALVGGAEALCRVVLSGFHALKLVAAEGCRPFDKDRPGITVGEGAALLVLETPAHARQRKAPVLATISGYAATCDAHHLTGPDPTATQAMRAIRLALDEAGIAPDAIGYVNAHGTGTRDNDMMESAALRGIFGAHVPPVSSTKRLTGHTFGAAGAIEAALCIQALRTHTLPPNAGTREPDETLVPTVREATAAPELRAALSCNFAFGGNNTALVLERA